MVAHKVQQATGNNGAVAVIVDVDDSTQAEFEDHAASNESVAVHTAFFLLKQQPGCGCPNGGKLLLN